MDEALRHKAMADALIAVSVDYSVQHYVAFSRACTQVHATAVQTQAATLTRAARPDLYR